MVSWFMTEPVKEIMKQIVDIAKKVGLGVREVFQEMDLAEIQELIDPTLEELKENGLIDMGASEPVPDDEEEAVEEAALENRFFTGLSHQGSPREQLTVDSLAEGSDH